LWSAKGKVLRSGMTMDQAQITDLFRPLFGDLGGEDAYPKAAAVGALHIG